MTRGADWYSFHARIDPIDTAGALQAALNDPQQRWYGMRRIAALAAAGALVAATWNPNLHPRGPGDGKFIERFGWVRWFDSKDLSWRTGWVSDIDGATGTLTVRSGGEKIEFPDAKNLYSRPKPKAVLDLPDPVSGTLPDKFIKVGGQGGSNPGALYQIDGSFADGSPDISRNSKMFQSFAAFRQPGSHNTFGSSFNVDATPDAFIPPEIDTVMIPRVDGTLDRYDVIQRFGSKWYRVPASGRMTVDDMMRPELEVPAADAFGQPGDTRRHRVFSDLGTVGFTRGSAFDVDDIADMVQQTGSPLPKVGDKYYVKKMNVPERARNEALANDFYELLGIPVPDVAVGSDGTTISSKLVGDTVAFNPNNPAHVKAAQAGFVADAWLANWDVIGQSFDNIQIDADGNAWRIDAGGAIEWRAMGKPKGAAFGDQVGELDSLRNTSLNPTAGKVFGGVGSAELNEQATVLQSVTPADIQDLADRHGLPHVGPVMIARRKSILDQLGITDPPPDAGSPLYPGQTPAEIHQTLTTPKPKATVYNPVEAVQQMGSPPTVAVHNWNLAVNALPAATVDPSEWDQPDLLDAIWKKDGDLWVADGPYGPTTTGDGHSALLRNLFTGEKKPFILYDGEDQYLTGYDKNIDDALVDNATTTRDLAVAEIVARTANIPLDQLSPFNVNPGVDDPPNMQYGTTGLGNWLAFETAWDRGRLGETGPEGAADRPLLNGTNELWEIVAFNPDSGVKLRRRHGGPDTEINLSQTSWQATGPWRIANNDTTAAIWKSKYAPLAADIGDKDPDGQALDQQTKIEAWNDSLGFGPDGGLNIPGDDGITDTVGIDVPDPVLDPATSAALDEALADQMADGVAVGGSHKVVNGVLAGLSPGEPILSTEMSVDDLADYEAMLGKFVVVLPIAAHEDPDWDATQLGSSNGLGTVIEVGTQEVWVKAASGYGGNYVTVPRMKVQKAGTNRYSWVTAGEQAKFKKVVIPVEQAPTIQQVTFKQNGDVVINGEKVGWYQKPGGAGNPYGHVYQAIIDGDHSITGKPMHVQTDKQSQLKVAANAVTFPITPKPTTPKTTKVTATEAEIKDLNLQLGYTAVAIEDIQQQLEDLANAKPATGVPLNDGSIPAKGDWVFSIKDGKYAQVLNPQVIGFAGKGVESPDMIKVKIQDPVTGKWKQSNRKRDQLVSVAGPGEQPFVMQTKAVMTASGDWIGPGSMVAYAGGSTVLDTTTDGQVKLLHPDGSQGWMSATAIPYAMSPTTKLKTPPGALDQGKVDSLNAELAALNDEHGKLAATIAGTVVAKPKKKKEIGTPFPGPDGMTIKQPANLAEARTAKGLKNTKDNYVPTPGMILRHNDGTQYVVWETGDEWSSHKNSVRVVPVGPGMSVWEAKWRAVSTMTVDHDAMLTDKDGAPLPIVSTVDGADWLPESGMIFRKDIEKQYQVKDPTTGLTVKDPTTGWAMYRTKVVSKFYVVAPEGTLYNIDGSLAPLNAIQPGMPLERVGYIDKSHPAGKKLTVSVQQHHNAQVGQVQYAVIHDPNTPAGLPLANAATPTFQIGDQVTYQGQPGEVMTISQSGTMIGFQPTGGVADWVPATDVTPSAPAAPVAPAPTPPTPAAPAAPPTPSAPNLPTSVEPTPTEELPVFVGNNPAGMELPHPPTTSSTAGVPAFQTQGGPHTLDQAGLAAAHSVTDSIAQTLDVAKQNKANGEKKWVSTYGLGDGDTIEDMLIRSQTVRDAQGNDYVEVSFRLEKNAAKKAHTTFMVTSKNEVGDWDATTRNAKNMVPGDQVAVRVASGGGATPSGALRPDEKGTIPNATVVAAPVLIGKNKAYGQVAEGTYDVYRTQVLTAGGEIGFIDLEDRNSADTIDVFLWDPLKPRQTNSSKALNPNAQADGWTIKSNQLTWSKSNGWQKSDIQADGVKAIGTSTSTAAPYRGSQSESMPFGNGTVLQRDVNGVHIEYATAPAKNSLDGHTVIRVRADDPDAQQKIADAMELVGVTKEAQQPPTRQALTQMAANKVYEQFNPVYSRGMTANGGVQQALDAIDAAVGQHMPNKRKATIDDISLRIAKDGRVQVLVSEDVAKAVVAKNNVNAYVHGFMASNKLDMLEAIFTGESPSVMSTTERFQHGIFMTGMSSGDDHGKDSADNLFFTLYKSKASKGDGSAVVDPVAMHRHTDYYFREGDRFGARESDQLNWLNKPVDGGEMMIQRRFEMDLFSYVVLSEPGRSDLIKKLHGRGITTAPNGKSLEDFLVTSPPSFYSVNFGDEVPLGSLPDDGTPIAGAPPVMAGV